MPRFNDQACGNDYTNAATLSEVFRSNGGSFNISNQDVFLELQYGSQGQTYWTDEVHVAVGNGAIDPGTTGVRFRNFTAGKIATVTAVLASSVEPAFTLGNPGAVVLTGNVLTGITGQVSAAGAVVAGTGFSVAHGGTGVYTITFTTAFPAPPTVMLTAVNTAACLMQINGVTANNFGVLANTSSTLAAADSAFHFVAFVTQ